MDHSMTDHIVAVFEMESAAEPLQRASERQHSLLRDWCGAAPELSPLKKCRQGRLFCITRYLFRSPGHLLECDDFLLNHDLVLDRVGMMLPLNPRLGLGAGAVCLPSVAIFRQNLDAQ
jgi:hypothetical protein